MVRSRPMPFVRFVTLCWLILSSGWFTGDLPVVSASTDPLNVVVTLPVLKDFVEQVGGPHVRVTSLLKGYENEHTYSPKPSDLVAVRNAQLLFEVGLGLEVWVTNLVKSAGRPSLTIITTSRGIGLIPDDHEGEAGHEDVS